MRKKGKFIIKLVAVGVLSGILFTGAGDAKIYAAQEYTVTAQKTIMYTADKAVVYTAPDLQATIVTVISPNLPVDVTGITSNGWYQIDLKGIYYIPANGLREKPDESQLKSYQADEITKLTKGTFSFFKNSELRGFTKDDIEEMDDNTYIKYLDSYLMGNHVIENCILVDSGLTLKEAYEGASAADNKVAAITMKDYLVNYRNQYLEDSFWGPVRTEEELKVTVNRAIRYDYKEFSTVYKNAIVGSESTKMESVLNEVIADIKAEQGITFTCEMDYGSYQNEEGKSTSGWIIEFTR
ncbi:MAG: SH3 domain-containing protein [Lachnospiraceae bacterium]|nr:SH3 domain-containing protein [Lachnospiraceae bacterium]